MHLRNVVEGARLAAVADVASLRHGRRRGVRSVARAARRHRVQHHHAAEVQVALGTHQRCAIRSVVRV